MNVPVSRYNPDYIYLCTVRGFNVFKSPSQPIYSVDGITGHTITEETRQSIIKYLHDEGFTTEPLYYVLK